MHHPDFIAELVKMYRPKVYLELGLGSGETFAKVSSCRIGDGHLFKVVERCIGVDQTPPPHLSGEVYAMSTDEFFRTHGPEVDFVFIDADHSYAAVVSDLKASLRILRKGGLICLHDTDPQDDSLMSPDRCGDCYRVVRTLNELFDVTSVTLPLNDAGITLVQRRGETRTDLRERKC